MGNQCCVSGGKNIDQQLPTQIKIYKVKESKEEIGIDPKEKQINIPIDIPTLFDEVKQEKSSKQNNLCAQPAQANKVEEKIEDLIDQFMHQYFTLHSDIWQFYQNHDIDSCIPYIKRLQHFQEGQFSQYQSMIAKNFSNIVQQYYNENQQKLKAAIPHLHLLTLAQIAQIKTEHKDILHYCEQISGGDWQQKSYSKGIRMSTRREGNSVGILIEMELEMPFQILVAILTEIDLYKEFVLYNEISRQELIFSRNCRIGYNLNNLPVLSKRQAFFQGIGYSRLRTHGEVFMFTRSIHDQPHLQQHLGYKAQINPKYVQLNYKYFIVRYHPVRKNFGRLTLALNADVGLNFLPNFILEYMAKDFGANFLERVLSIGKEYKGSQWQKRIEKNPQLFNYFHNEIEEYLRNKK